mgnify:CR=1 FL=1
MNHTHHLVTWAAVAALFASACVDPTQPEPSVEPAAEPEGPPTEIDLGTHYYEAEYIPAHFGVETEGQHLQQPLMTADNTPDDNRLTDSGAALGRVLFYDVNLSFNRTVSCSSCHLAEFGFSDDKVLSEGFEGGETGRHSMGLTNARFYDEGSFFWDQRAETLEDQVLMPFQDEVEMGMTLELVVERVEEQPYYEGLFADAFGDDEVTTDRISKALAQFVRSMISTRSKYDEGRAQVQNRRDPFPNFTEEENLGKMLFVSPPPLGGFACFICHQGEGFIAANATSNGLDPVITDRGYGKVTEDPLDEGTFKVPSLRNVAVRAPYMHDGRFASLEEVIDHYSEGINKNAPNLSGPFFGPSQFNMTPTEKAALIAFLNTLTDEAMLTDPKFADPFVYE